MKKNPADAYAVDKMIVWGSLALFAILFVWMVLSVPMNLDEALPFHALACSEHPASFWNTFFLPCGGTHNDMITPFGFTYQRAYLYLGAMSSFVFKPFYSLSPTIGMQYAYGALWFSLVCFCLSRLTQKPFQSFFVFLCFFPILFQFIHDTGPVKISAFVFVLAPLFYDWSYRKTAGLQIVAGALLGLLFGLATEDKVYFVYLLPSLFLMMIARGRKDPTWTSPFVSFLSDFWKGPRWASIKKLLSNKDCGWPFLWTLAIVGALGIAAVFFSHVDSGKTYLAFVREQDSNLSFAALIKKLWYNNVLNLPLFTLYWPSYAHRIFEPRIRFWGIVFGCFTAFFFYACFVFYRQKNRLGLGMNASRAWLYLASSAAFLLIATSISSIWAGHHYIFLWFPLLLLFADLLSTLEKTKARCLICCFWLLNAFCVFQLSSQKLPIHTAQERNKILTYFADEERAASSLINVASWGFYQIQALYAPQEALVTDGENLGEETAAKLYEIAQKTHRQKIYIVCSLNCSRRGFEEVFGRGLRFSEIQLGLEVWHVFVSDLSTEGKGL